MKKFHILFGIIAAVTMIGCSAGDTPVEKYDAKPEAKQDSVGGALESNPNLPPAAKGALLGGNK
jgi:hypothetical protein